MKNTIIGAIIGVCVAVTVFHVWFYYKMSVQTQMNTQNIAEIVNFINSQIKPEVEE